MTGIQRELLVDKKTGLVRQAGTLTPEGKFVVEFRQRCEQSLFVFAKGVLGYDFLSPHLHREMARFIADTPLETAPLGRRKMVLVPRFHGKSLLGCNCLPLHMMIQPKEANRYFPGMPGTETRVLLSGEKLDRAQDHVRVMETTLESNTLLRAMWPQVAWDEPRRQSKKWNDSEFIIPRAREFPDPTVRAIGVGGAITGAHPNVLIEDDLTTQDAANSELVMRAAIDCHVAWRALLSDPVRDLQYVFATRWGVHDLPGYIYVNDPSFQVMKREVVERGQTIWPEKFSLKDVEAWKAEFGTMFPLFFLNRATDKSLVDFSIDDVRACVIADGVVYFDEDERDVRLATEMGAPAPHYQKERAGYDALTGIPLSTDIATELRLNHVWRMRRGA